ncbi:MAG: radical SAM protein [Anaerolineae bacterium]
MEMDERLAQAWRIRRANFPPEIEFDYPLKTAVISLTGSQCALDCAHCGGYYLQSMMPIWRVEAKGATSCLISGGCDKWGRVPVTAHLQEVAALRKGRTMNWHVGLIEAGEIQTIAPYVDVISFDFVGDDETIRQVYGLERGVEDYVKTYELLRKYARVVPHITIGLQGGEIVGEYRALELLTELGVDGLVLIVFIPTPGTRYADRQPPEIEAVVDVMVEARLRFPTAPLHLGCMRPYGDYRSRLDPLAVRAGVNKIVSPAREAVRLAEELGLNIVRGEECCVIPQTVP